MIGTGSTFGVSLNLILQQQPQNIIGAAKACIKSVVSQFQRIKMKLHHLLLFTGPLCYPRIPVLPVFWNPDSSLEYSLIFVSLALPRLCAERWNHFSYKWRGTGRHPVSRRATHTLPHLPESCCIDEHLK